jgi:hypothetical protein
MRDPNARRTCELCQMTRQDKDFYYILESDLLDVCQKCADKWPVLAERVKNILNNVIPLPVQSYLLPRRDIEKDHPDPLDITLERRPALYRGSQWGTDCWAICRGRECMDKMGKWNTDRVPPEVSIRVWQTTCHWSTPQEAYEFWMTTGRKVGR